MIPGINASGRFDPLTRVYRDRLVARSGTISPASIDAADTLIRSSRVSGWNTGLRLLWTIQGSNTAARRTAIVGGGTNGEIVVTGIFSVDSEASGMRASGATGDVADLGVSLSGSVNITLACDVLQDGFEDSGNLMGSFLAGEGSATQLGHYGDPEYPASAYISVRGEGVEVATASTGLFTGTAGTDSRLYLNSTLLGTEAISGSRLPVGAGNFMGWTIGDFGYTCDWRIGTFAIWDVALTGGQVADFHSALTTFKATIGRS